MKVGSLVELVNDNWKTTPYPNEVFPIKGKIYTVRDIVDDCIRLEEIVNPKNYFLDKGNKVVFDEQMFFINKFRELQSPISNIEETINQNTLEDEPVNPYST